jgi:hypothetical protein
VRRAGGDAAIAVAIARAVVLRRDAAWETGRHGTGHDPWVTERPVHGALPVAGDAERRPEHPAATTDASGTAVLRWPVDPATSAGSWRIDATCGGQTLSTHVPIE